MTEGIPVTHQCLFGPYLRIFEYIGHGGNIFVLINTFSQITHVLILLQLNIACGPP